MSNATTTSQDDISLLDLVFYVGNGSLGALFNAIVLYIAFRYVDTDEKPGQIIVMNMTAADFLFCVIYVITRPFLQFLALELCSIYYIVIYTVQLCSCMNLLWLNVDKLLFIHMPLHYYHFVSRTRLLIVSTGTWLCLSTFASFEALSLGTDKAMTCFQVTSQPLVYFFLCLMYVLMIFASFVISGIIYIIAMRSTRSEQRARSKMFQRLLFVFSSTMWTFLTCLPYRFSFALFNLIKSQGSPPDWDKSTIMMVNYFYKMLVIGIVFNPLITMFTQRVYRNRVVAMLRIFGLLKPKNENSSQFTNSSGRASIPRGSIPSTRLLGIEETRPLSSTTNV